MGTKKKYQRTVDKIFTKAYNQFGASMGRSNVGEKPDDKKVYDCKVRMYDGAYDKGGAYFGMGKELRVSYTKDLSYIRFYRVGDDD
jgi:hypothetical protein